MSYVDGFVVPVPFERLKDYRKLSKRAGKVWREHGALAYVECVGDDVPPGKHTSFTKAVKLKDGEVVVFSWIVFNSRAHRDAVNKKVMSDPRFATLMKVTPFDGKRLIYGGFKPIIEM
ncbi:DUF1428 domain-containing protein [Hyphomicrobium sp. B1]|jgi:uncharacterized protein YbaA (DUF1428 family)|uniref:DUF1428 domain-containing protein n=1 Tax=unclassified Hyphomicrobium TaxID=2619925 RepID=UPI000213F7B7|nr:MULTISPECIES: DUF1428 domain-containing protein [unclassified Hyphomicrobium]CCB63275.1 conserved protein of unknown function [Hyphomicrobium sp. MC1]